SFKFTATNSQWLDWIAWTARRCSILSRISRQPTPSRMLQSVGTPQPSVEPSTLKIIGSLMNDRHWCDRVSLPNGLVSQMLMRRRGAAKTFSFRISHEQTADAFHTAWRWAVLLHGLGSARYLGPNGRLSVPRARRGGLLRAKGAGGHFRS